MSSGGDESGRRLRAIDKSLYYWDVDNRRGQCIPTAELSRVVVTYTGDRHADVLARWVLLLRSTFEVTATQKPHNSAAAAARAPAGAALTRDSFEALACATLASDPLLCAHTAPETDWARHLEVTELEAPQVPSGDGGGAGGGACARGGVQRRFSMALRGLTPTRLADTEAVLGKWLGAPQGGGGGSPGSIELSDLGIVEATIPAEGVAKARARALLIEVTLCLTVEQLDAFVCHAMATLDLVCNISHSNHRTHVLFETFKLWDAADRGFVDTAAFRRRILALPYVQERGTAFAASLGLPDLEDAGAGGVTLLDFKGVLGRLFADCAEAEADDMLRALKRQLVGDDSSGGDVAAAAAAAADEPNNTCDPLSASLRAAARSELDSLRVKRLESSLRHAFDSVALDDITSLLDGSVAPPAARQMHTRVATATCVLLDLSPTVVEGQEDPWTTLVEGLRTNMVGFLCALHEFNPASLSYVRICLCMSALEEHAYPSRVLSYSWFLAGLSEWCRTTCELVSLQRGWEWPPARLQGRAAAAASAVPRPPSAPLRGASASARQRLLAKPSRVSSAKKNGERGGGGGAAGGGGHQQQQQQQAGGGQPQGSAPCIVPQSPFRANNLFLRRRKSKGDTYQMFLDKTAAHDRRTRDADESGEVGSADAAGGRTPAELRGASEVEIQHYAALTDLNDSLGLPQQPAADFTEPPMVWCTTVAMLRYKQISCGIPLLLTQALRPYWDTNI